MLKKLSTFIDFQTPSEHGNRAYEVKSHAKSADGFDFLHLIQSWQEIAGNKLSEHTIPLKNHNGTLTVLSNHSAFANEMKFMETQLKRKIFMKFPNLEKNIKTIHFIVDSTYFNSQVALLSKNVLTPKKATVEKPHPFSPEAKKLQKEAEELFKNITDEELKKTFESIYIQSKFNANK